MGVFVADNEEIVLPVTEIISHKEFFDYEAKYTPSLADEITPAQIPDSVRDKVQKQALKIYKLLNMKGIARVDFIFTNKDLYFLEINTVPGMSEQSIAPQQIQKAGYTLTDFFSKMIEDALKRG